jgi:hypothetical protein
MTRSHPLAIVALGIALTAMRLSAQSTPAAGNHPALLDAAAAGALLPDQVFFRGQSATTQKRNSAGVKFADGKFALAILVDNGGYSSSIQQKYQGFLIVEDPIEIEGKRLSPGQYGFGFVGGDHFVVMDAGAHDLFAVPDTRDSALRRAMPLQIRAASTGYRLYEGRTYVTFSAAE